MCTGCPLLHDMQLTVNVERYSICAHSWIRFRNRMLQYVMICHMIHCIPGHAAKFVTPLWCVLVCAISIVLDCVYAIQARIVAVHVNASHHTWLLIRMNEHGSCCKLETWLILPVVICLYQRLSHACVCIYFYIVKPRIAH